MLATRWWQVIDPPRLVCMSGQQGEPQVPGRAGTAPGSDRVGTLTSLSDGREFSLGFTSMRIGRQWRADLIISDRSVSRQHADIIFENGCYVLYDHSADRTWVNGSLVQVARPLRDGDAVKFGRAEFRFTLRDSRNSGARVRERPPEVVGPSPVVKEGKRWRRSGPAKLLRMTFLALAAVVATAAVAIYWLFIRGG